MPPFSLRVRWLAPGPSAPERPAYAADGRRVGRVSDVIADGATGRPLAYALETLSGCVRYLPAALAVACADGVWLHAEAGPWLGDRGADPAAAILDETAEFALCEDFPDPW